MERELIELFEAVKKAADAAASPGVGEDSSPEEDRCLDALKRLKKFPVNYQVLVSTQVGKRLRQLTKHPRKKIQTLASDLVDVWKNIIVEETLKNKKNGSLDNKDSVKAEPVGPETSKAKKFQMVDSFKVSMVESVKLEKNDQNGIQNSDKVIKSESFSTEKKFDPVKIQENTSRVHTKVEKITREERQTSDVSKPTPSNDARKPTPYTVGPPKLNSIIYCKDPLRDKIRELLADALCRVPGEVDEETRDEANARDPYRVSVSVESAMFEKWGKSNGAQKFKYRSIMFNIKDPNNPDFRRKVLLGHVTPERVLEMTPEEMASDERQLQNVKIKEKALFHSQRGGPPKATTDQFKCGRCGKRKCTYYQLQTRSADEPMTTFVTCVNCDNHWKFC